MNTSQNKYGFYFALGLLPILGILFAWRLLHVPSRIETAVWIIGIFIVPVLQYPRFGPFWLLCIPLFIPMFRRMYYLIEARPQEDYLMLIGDGVMGSMILAVGLLWIRQKDFPKDALSILVLIYGIWLFIKIFFLQIFSLTIGFYGFKFNGLYVFFYLATGYLALYRGEIDKMLRFGAVMLFITAMYSGYQILFGYTDFEKKWLDSIVFTTLRIDGVVRPFGTYVSPAAMSDAMAILAVLGVSFLFRPGFMKPVGILFILAAVPPLVMATVRTNWAAAGLGVLFLGGFARIPHRGARIILIVAGCIGLAVLMMKSDSQGDGGNTQLSQAAVGNKNKAQILLSKRASALTNPMQEYSIQKRMQIWTEIWWYAIRNPLGRGQGTHGYAHSYYFQILGETGFPGLFLFISIIFLSIKRGWKLAMTSQDTQTRELALTALTMVIMLSVLNITGTHLHTQPGDLYFWLSVGIISRLHGFAEKEKEQELVQASFENNAIPNSFPLP